METDAFFCFALKCKLTKLNQEHRELKEKLKEERKQIEELWRTKTELEDERRMQDRAMEQLQRKVILLSRGLMGESCIFLEPEEG